MWSALIRETGDAADATTIATSSATHGSVSGVCHCGRRRDATIAAPHAANATEQRGFERGDRLARQADERLGQFEWRDKRQQCHAAE